MATRAGSLMFRQLVRDVLAIQNLPVWFAFAATSHFSIGSIRRLTSECPSVTVQEKTTMLHTLGLLLGCQLLGEITVRGFGIAMPGPVLGLALLVLLLRALPTLGDQVRPTITVMLAHLSFLFVPAGVGVIGNFEVLLDDGLTLLFILTLSTVFSMLATVGTFVGVRHLIERRAA